MENIYMERDVAYFTKLHLDTVRTHKYDSTFSAVGKERPMLILWARGHDYNVLEFTSVKPKNGVDFFPQEDGTPFPFTHRLGFKKTSYLRLIPLDRTRSNLGKGKLTQLTDPLFEHIQKEAAAKALGFRS